MLRNEERSKNIYLSFNLKALEKEQIEFNMSRKKEVIKIRVQINERENDK